VKTLLQLGDCEIPHLVVGFTPCQRLGDCRAQPKATDICDSKAGGPCNDNLITDILVYFTATCRHRLRNVEPNVVQKLMITLVSDSFGDSGRALDICEKEYSLLFARTILAPCHKAQQGSAADKTAQIDHKCKHGS
jgi:hypothetical protein